MIYVASDIHGNFGKYKQLFTKVTDNDSLFILGDIVDRGKDSIKILQDMMMRVNVYPIMGNHEDMALSIFKKLLEKITEESILDFDQEFLEGFTNWYYYNGGESTLKEFIALSKDERENIIEYIEEFAPFDKVWVGSREYILVHTLEIENFSEEKPLSEYSFYDILWGDVDYNTKYYKNKILVTGHTPVNSIEANNFKKTVYKGNNHIAIDCGCGFNGKLALYCLDTDEEFYF